MSRAGIELRLGALAPVVADRLARWRTDEVLRRIEERDFRLWAEAPEPELVDRLGWLDLPTTSQTESAAWRQLAAEVEAAGFERVVVLGMGGSSLAPEVFANTFGSASGLPLKVLDSTHPDAVTACTRGLDPAHTLFLVSSKSGGTIETISFFRHFWGLVGGAVGEVQCGGSFVAITDPGTDLEALARDRGFRQVCPGPPDVGGRFSALSAFGMVPAALLGMDVDLMLTRAKEAADRSFGPDGYGPASALALGAAMGELARAGKDKLTLLPSRSIASFPDWLEQLVAESLGKLGRGVVPVAGERPVDPRLYPRDRFLVVLQVDGDDPVVSSDWLAAAAVEGHPVARLRMADAYDLGAQFFEWELGTAAAGSLLGVQPFVQPDVQLAKDLAKRAMREAATGDAAALFPSMSVASPEARGELQQWLEETPRGGYVAIQAFLSPSGEAKSALEEFRRLAADRAGVATTLGIGPRFLHSTGQMHKGGPENGRFLQIVDRPARDVAVPETDYSFGRLVRAQADGDAGALAERGRPVLRLELAGAVTELGSLLRHPPAVE